MMNKISVSVCLAIAISIVGQAMATNLLPNGGFDDGTMSGWGTAGGATATWDVHTDASAPSPSYVNTFSRNGGPFEGSAMGQDGIAMTAGRIYRYGVSMRDIDGTLDNAHLRMVVEAPPAWPEARTDFAATANWETYQRAIYNPDQVRFYHSTRINDGGNGSMEFDSYELIDVTDSDRMINGGFENSSSRTLDWSTAGTLTSTVVTDSAEGNNAILLSRTTDSWGVLHKDNSMMPWLGATDDEVHLSFSVKDDITIATDEYLRIGIAAFDSAGAWSGWDMTLIKAAGSGSYADYYEILGGVPTNAAYMTVNIRVSDQFGNDIAGDILVDDIQLANIPEPTTMLLLGMGGLLSLIKKKRHN